MTDTMIDFPGVIAKSDDAADHGLQGTYNAWQQRNLSSRRYAYI